MKLVKDGNRPAPRQLATRYKFLERIVRDRVRAGYTPPSMIGRAVEDLIELEGAPRSTAPALERIAGDEMGRIRDRPKPDPCVNDMIVAAFTSLRRCGVVALENAGFTQSDGWEDVCGFAKHRAEQFPAGGCWFTEQGVTRALDGNGLSIYFRAWAADRKPYCWSEKASPAVGRIVVATLEEHGVDTLWDGTAARSIQIPPFEWFRVPIPQTVEG